MPTPKVELPPALICLQAVTAILGRERNAVYAFIESGDLPAFNLGVEIFSRSEIRVFAPALANVQRGTPRRMEFAEIIGAIFPACSVARAGVVLKIKLAVLAQKLNCSAEHVSNLVDAGWLKPVAGSKARRGPGGSMEVELSTVQDFLKKRRMHA